MRYILQIYQVGSNTFFGRGLVEKAVDLLRGIPDEKDDTEIDVWLQTNGGSADAAYHLGHILRGYASTLRIVVPSWAKSAGTLFCLSADELYMDRLGELGPLDAQVQHPLHEEHQVSALDIAESIEQLAQVAISVVISAGADVIKYTGITRSVTLSYMLDFASKFIGPISSKIDPHLLHAAIRVQRASVRYAIKLMYESKICSKKPNIPGVAELLANHYPTHSFVIDADEARNLGLNVRDMSTYDLKEEVAAFHLDNRDNDGTFLELVNSNEIAKDEKPKIDEKPGGDQHEEKPKKKSTN